MARSTRMLFFMAGLLPVFEKTETEDDDIDEEREDEAVEQVVEREESTPSLDAEGLESIDKDGRQDHQDEADIGRLRDGTEAHGLDEFVFLLLFGQAHEQGRERRRQIERQRPELAVRLRDKLQPIEQQKDESEQDGASDQQRPADALERVGEEVMIAVHGLVEFF